MKTSLAWSFFSILIYLLCSCGYIVLDVLSIVISINNSTLYIIYIVLAGVFVFEAILYTIYWCQYVCCQQESEGIWEYKFKCFASIFHIIGSVAYLLGAIFGAHIPQDQQNLLATPQLFVCNIIGMVALIIEAILILIGWMCRPLDEKSCHCPNGVILWAHLLNILGRLIYLVASILPPIMTAIYSATITQTTIYQNYVRPVQIAGDSIYLIDALLYMVLWFKERKQQNKNKDKEPLGPQGRRIRFLR